MVFQIQNDYDDRGARSRKPVEGNLTETLFFVSVTKFYFFAAQSRWILFSQKLN